MEVKKRAKIITDWINNYCDTTANNPKSLIVGVSGGMNSSVGTLCANWTQNYCVNNANQTNKVST